MMDSALSHCEYFGYMGIGTFQKMDFGVAWLIATCISLCHTSDVDCKACYALDNMLTKCIVPSNISLLFLWGKT